MKPASSPSASTRAPASTAASAGKTAHPQPASPSPPSRAPPPPRHPPQPHHPRRPLRAGGPRRRSRSRHRQPRAPPPRTPHRRPRRSNGADDDHRRPGRQRPGAPAVLVGRSAALKVPCTRYQSASSFFRCQGRGCGRHSRGGPTCAVGAGWDLVGGRAAARASTRGARAETAATRPARVARQAGSIWTRQVAVTSLRSCGSVASKSKKSSSGSLVCRYFSPDLALTLPRRTAGSRARKPPAG